MSTMRRVYSISALLSYDTIDSDNNSFSFAKSDKHLGSNCLHANVPQEYHTPLLNRSQQTHVPLCGDDEIRTNAELFSKDSDCSDSYYSKDSIDDLLSLDTAIHISKPSCNRSDDVRKFDGLPSFPFFPSSYSHHTNALGKYEVSVSLPSLYKNKAYIPDSGTQCNQTVQPLSHDLSHDSNHSFTLVNGLEDASTVMSSSSSPSNHTPTSSLGFVPSAVNFANECLKRSIARRSLDVSSPSNLSIATIKDSVLTTHLVALQKSSSVVSSSISSQKSIAPSTTLFYEASKTIQLVESMLEDMNQSFYTSCVRVQEIKRELRSMEIKYYRRKCVWSLRKSMAYLKLYDSSVGSYDSSVGSYDCDDPSICSELSVSHHVHKGRDLRIAQMLEIAWEVMCINLVIAMVCMFYVLYKDTLNTVSEVVEIRKLILGSELEDDI